MENAWQKIGKILAIFWQKAGNFLARGILKFQNVSAGNFLAEPIPKFKIFGHLFIGANDSNSPFLLFPFLEFSEWVGQNETVSNRENSQIETLFWHGL